MFVKIIENILPVNYYIEVACVMADCEILIELLKKEEPKLIMHIKALNCEVFLNNIFIKWFISLFIEGLEHNTFITVWNCMFIEGNISLFKAAISILSLNKSEILNIHSTTDFMQFINKDYIKVPSQKDLIKMILERKFCFNINIINTLREQCFPKILNKIYGIKIRKYLNNINTSDVCYKHWNYCQYKKYSEPIPNVLVLRNYNGYIKIDDDFYGDNTYNKIEEYNNKSINKITTKKLFLPLKTFNELMQLDKYNDLLIERKYHLDCCKEYIIENNILNTNKKKDIKKDNEIVYTDNPCDENKFFEAEKKDN